MLGPAEFLHAQGVVVDSADFTGKPLAFTSCSLGLASYTGVLYWVKLQKIPGEDGLLLSYCWSYSDAGPKKMDVCKYGRGGHLSPWRARWALVAYGSPLLSDVRGDGLMACFGKEKLFGSGTKRGLFASCTYKRSVQDIHCGTVSEIPVTNQSFFGPLG